MHGYLCPLICNILATATNTSSKSLLLTPAGDRIDSGGKPTPRHHRHLSRRTMLICS